ncbi:twin-arginine translocase TatA/TatE family subunit [Kitasatospora sp. NPDC006697]|uniref:twin-arginine translocase TatA/TatE family subunit n=1 Tax=Kitasatospora sp. NPDC006697 TaxID=3364020 RepID=UPI0036A47A33
MGRVLAFLIIVVMAAAFFGGKRLPELARSVGRSMRILKRETAALREEYAKEAHPVEPAPVEPARVVKAAPGAAVEPPAGRAQR